MGSEALSQNTFSDGSSKAQQRITKSEHSSRSLGECSAPTLPAAACREPAEGTGRRGSRAGASRRRRGREWGQGRALGQGEQPAAGNAGGRAAGAGQLGQSRAGGRAASRAGCGAKLLWGHRATHPASQISHPASHIPHPAPRIPLPAPRAPHPAPPPVSSAPLRGSPAPAPAGPGTPRAGGGRRGWRPGPPPGAGSAPRPGAEPGAPSLRRSGSAATALGSHSSLPANA